MTRKHYCTPVCTLELVPILQMIAPYKVEVYDSRHGPELTLYENGLQVKTIRITEDIADKIIEAKQVLNFFPGLDELKNKLMA